MTFPTLALPDVSTLAAALRAKRCHARVVFLPRRTPRVAPSPKDPQRPPLFSLG